MVLSKPSFDTPTEVTLKWSVPRDPCMWELGKLLGPWDIVILYLILK